LTVLEPRLRVIEPLCDVESYVGDRCTLECVLSRPVVDVTWCKDGLAMLCPNADFTEVNCCRNNIEAGFEVRRIRTQTNS